MKALIVLAVFLVANSAYAETRIIDGDTLKIGDTTFRLNGIDAPEHGQRCGTWNCGAEATEALVEIIKSREVTCDAIAEDGFGRVIATCFADGADVGRTLVDKGLAWAFVKYSDAYTGDEARARIRGIGIWSGRFEPPWAFREARWTAATESSPQGCPIKGNISRNGRIYHAPWSPWYNRTRINAAKGEHWFCSEAEAVAAGWRAPFWD